MVHNRSDERALYSSPIYADREPDYAKVERNGNQQKVVKESKKSKGKVKPKSKVYKCENFFLSLTFKEFFFFFFSV